MRRLRNAFLVGLVSLILGTLLVVLSPLLAILCLLVSAEQWDKFKNRLKREFGQDSWKDQHDELYGFDHGSE